MILCALLLLGGCSAGNDPMEEAMVFRDKLLQAQGCSFTAEIIADYGDYVYTFSTENTADSLGVMRFRITQPDTICGITGQVGQEGAALTFDDKLLAIPALGGDQLSPAAAPWFFLNSLRSGYISSVSREGDHLRMSLSDSFHKDGLIIDVWFTESWEPVQCRFYFSGSDIAALHIENFSLL